MSRVDERTAEAIRKLDEEDLLLFLLLTISLGRENMVLSAALEEYGLTPRCDDHVAKCAVDYDLLGRIRKICPKDEALAWRRALTCCVERGDERKAAALQELMHRRAAS